MTGNNKIRATFDSNDAQLELDRLSKGMDAKTRKALASRFEQLWQETQRKVHVESGALKASGRRYVRDDAKKWRGTITYGGYTPVARHKQKENPNEVDYAVIENDRAGSRKKAPGTPHRFFAYDMFDHAMDDIERDVADWLTRRDARNARRRAQYAAKKAAT